MHRHVRFATFALALCVSSTVARAQLRQTADNFNMWFSYYGELGLQGRWGLMYDFSMRRSGPVDELAALFARAGVTYAIHPNVRIAAGVNRSETWPYGDVPIAYRTPERRLWEQLQLTHGAGRVSFAHRYRLEQRWQGHKDPPSDDVTNWVRTGRFRYQVKATIPFQGSTLEAHEFYGTVADELFVNFGSNIQYNVYDQNRAALSLGYRLNKSLRLEAGYMEQLGLKSSGKQLEDNHTVIFSMYTNFSLKKPQ